MDLFLAGGGTTEQEAQVWAAAFAGVTNVLYWPFALADERAPAAEAWLSDGMHSLGITAAVSMWTSLAGHDAPELAGYDLVFVGGGTTSKLVNHIRRYGFDTALADHIRGGGRYYGGSAGALLPCEWITLASMIEDDPEAAGTRGIDVFNGASIFPHADTYPPGTAAHLAERLGHSLYALPEASGLHVSDRTISPIGPGAIRIARPDGAIEVLG